MRTYTAKDLDAMLKCFGVSRKRPLLLHSSLPHLGLMEGVAIEKIPEAILEYFLDRCDRFFQPAFNYAFAKTGFIDLNEPNSEVGMLSNTMIAMGFARTLHPIFSIVGNDETLVRPACVEQNPFGSGSFFDRLNDEDGVVIVLGAKPMVATIIIYAEFLAGVRYRFLKPFEGEVVNRDIKVSSRFYHFVLPLQEYIPHAYCAFHRYLLENGIAKMMVVGGARAYGFEVKEFVPALKAYIAKDPFRLLSRKPKRFYAFIDGKECPVEDVS